MSLLRYLMIMFVCEKEACLLCAGVECERSIESAVRSRERSEERPGERKLEVVSES